MNSQLTDTATTKKACISPRLMELMRITGYYTDQINGQRIFRPIKDISPPPKGCEIFVGNLPQDIYEEDLVPLFAIFGPIYEMRLMVDFGGRTRGFGFINYFNQESAMNAIKYMDKFEIRRNRFIGVYLSIDNRRLYVGGLPLHFNKNDIQEAFAPYAEGLKEIILYSDRMDKTKNRGFAFLEFESHRLAALARKKTSGGGLVLWGKPVSVEWADPLPVIEPDVMAQITNIYLRNVPLDTEVTSLIDHLYMKLPGCEIEHCHIMMDFAFVHFINREHAEYAMQQLSKGFIIDDHDIEVTWARPPAYSKKNREDEEPKTLCTSLPPRMRQKVHVFRKKVTQCKIKNNCTNTLNN